MKAEAPAGVLARASPRALGLVATSPGSEDEPAVEVSGGNPDGFGPSPTPQAPIGARTTNPTTHKSRHKRLALRVAVPSTMAGQRRRLVVTVRNELATLWITVAAASPPAGHVGAKGTAAPGALRSNGETAGTFAPTPPPVLDEIVTTEVLHDPLNPRRKAAQRKRGRKCAGEPLTRSCPLAGSS